MYQLSESKSITHPGLVNQHVSYDVLGINSTCEAYGKIVNRNPW